MNNNSKGDQKNEAKIIYHKSAINWHYYNQPHLLYFHSNILLKSEQSITSRTHQNPGNFNSKD